jgi:hypothetical protein
MPSSDDRAPSVRFAGAILFATALLALAAGIVAGPLGPARKLVAFVDLALGASLLTGRGWRTLASLRCLGGAVVLSGLQLSDGHFRVVNDDWAAAATEMLYSAGLLLLLVGRPGKLGIAAGALVSLFPAADWIWLLARR